MPNIHKQIYTHKYTHTIFLNVNTLPSRENRILVGEHFVLIKNIILEGVFGFGS